MITARPMNTRPSHGRQAGPGAAKSVILAGRIGQGSLQATVSANTLRPGMNSEW
jgi:hypothetical protein